MLNIKKLFIFFLTCTSLGFTTNHLVARGGGNRPSAGNRSTMQNNGQRQAENRAGNYGNKNNLNNKGPRYYGPGVVAGALGGAAVAAGNYSGDYYGVDDDGEDTPNAEQVADDENQNYELHESYLM